MECRDIVKLCALGGLDENGRDCYVVEINDDIFVLDAGTSLPDKTLPGVDFIIPNSDYLIKNKERIKAYIMTHGHDENMGALKYFYDKAPAPIYCSAATRSVILTQAEICNIKTRMTFEVVEPTSSHVIANRNVHFFQTFHNMVYSFGVAIETSEGNIVYSGDFIIDYTMNAPGYFFDLKALAQISKKPTLVLLTESKNANIQGYCSPKHRLTPLIDKYFAENRRIFITCFWQNLFRIHEISALCKKYHKKVYFYNEYTKTCFAGYHKFVKVFSENEIVAKEDLLRVRSQDLVVIMLGHNELLYSDIDTLASGNCYDKRLQLYPDDIFICAALPTPTLEVMCTHSVDNLYKAGCEVVWLQGKQLTAMHAREDDLRLMLTLLKPKYYFPVRGYYVNLMNNAKLGLSTGVGLNHLSVFVLDNGMRLTLDYRYKPVVKSIESEGYHIEPLLVDGRGIAGISGNAIEERKRLSVDGTLIIAATVSNKSRTIIAGPDCQVRGFVYAREAEPLMKSISTIFVDEVNKAFLEENIDWEKVKRNIQDRGLRFIRRENGREPYIEPIIIER